MNFFRQNWRYRTYQNLSPTFDFPVAKMRLFPLLLLNAALLSGGCIPQSKPTLTTEDYLEALDNQDIRPLPLPMEGAPVLDAEFDKQPIASFKYKTGDSSFAIYEFREKQSLSHHEQNGSVLLATNLNLVLVTDGEADRLLIEVFQSLRPPLSYEQAGLFIYPLGFCLLVAIFVIAERSYSLRRGMTFPRKVEKALRLGEFPDKKWKKRSAAERISFVATKESASPGSLRAYARLEIAALEQGLFLLEVVVAGAPLIGLLGTVTGLVSVFSAMPASGGSDGAIFSEGIALALLTTIMGLAIAIPALIGHAYLMRIVEKRAASLDWLTARLIEAVAKPKDETP